MGTATLETHDDALLRGTATGSPRPAPASGALADAPVGLERLLECEAPTGVANEGHCWPPAEQASCCEPSAKAACCGAPGVGGCGCG